MPKLMTTKNSPDFLCGQKECPCEPLLHDGDIHAYYTLRGSIADSASPYDGFNVCHYTGDSEEHVAACRGLLCGRFGVQSARLIVPRQTHSVRVGIIDTIPVDSRRIEDVDALVSSLDDIIIGVSTADCVPVVFADSHAGVVGVAHAGWRGALGGIVRNTLEAMVNLGADLSAIKVAIGPSICVDCFEVGEEVASRFPLECVERRNGWERPHVNLQRYVTGNLVQAGVREENVTPFVREVCTKCHPEKYFSARYLGVGSGRVFTFVKR